MKNKFLNNIYRYREIKEEIDNIFNNYKNNNLLPKGVIFYGSGMDGFEKELMANEFAKLFECQIFQGVIQKGNTELNINLCRAIHEAGHAYYIYKYCNTKKFLSVYFDRLGAGHTISKFNSETIDYIESIRSYLAGLVAEELVLGKHGIGCIDDLEEVYQRMYILINRNCIDGVEYYVPENGIINKEQISEYIKRKFDIKIRKAIKKQYWFVKRQLRRNKRIIKSIADYLLKYHEINLDQLKKMEK